MAPTDLHGLTLSTTTEAADAYNRALRRILLVRAGAEEAMADAAAADGLLRVRPELDRLGGSAAQREVLEDTLLHALLQAGRVSESRALLVARLDRRPSRADLRQLSALCPVAEMAA